jgi:hypothetical protein
MKPEESQVWSGPSNGRMMSLKDQAFQSSLPMEDTKNHVWMYEAPQSKPKEVQKNILLIGLACVLIVWNYQELS